MTAPQEKPRHFYRDPLAAAWMSRHHKMNLQVHHVYEGADYGFLNVTALQVDAFYDGTAHYVEATNDTDDFAFGGEDSDDRFSGVFYIHPDSLHLLEPRAGDIVQNPDDEVARVCRNEEEKPFQGWVKLADAKEFVGTAATIIQRNGLAFHWPESDAA